MDQAPLRENLSVRNRESVIDSSKWRAWFSKLVSDMNAGDLIYDSISSNLSIPATSITIPNLSDNFYEVEMVLVPANAADVQYSIFFNGDLNAANYSTHRLSASVSGNGVVTAAFQSGVATIITANAGGIVYISGKVFYSSNRSAIFQYNIDQTGTGANDNTGIRSVITNGNVSSINQIDIVANAANGFRAGSLVRIWREK